MSQTNQTQPPVAAPPQGYPTELNAKDANPSHDRYVPVSGGYPQQGYLSPGYPPQVYPPQGYPYGYPQQGYPPQGYPPQGYPPQGYPPQGYPPQGYLHYVPPQQHKPDTSFMEGW